LGTDLVFDPVENHNHEAKNARIRAILALESVEFG